MVRLVSVRLQGGLVRIRLNVAFVVGRRIIRLI